jgi:hypothetical protein
LSKKGVSRKPNMMMERPYNRISRKMSRKLVCWNTLNVNSRIELTIVRNSTNIPYMINQDNLCVHT